MITLLFIRHGIAEDLRPQKTDAARALTVEGWDKTRAAMRGLVKRGYLPTRGISSPYRRAAETMVCLTEATPKGFPVVYQDGLRPMEIPSNAEEWLRALLAEAEEGETLAFVGHNPFLPSLVEHLTGHYADMKKASCTVVHWDGVHFSFAAHLSPAELRSL